MEKDAIGREYEEILLYREIEKKLESWLRVRWQSRRALVRSAMQGDREALRTCWEVYKCRFPLVEARLKGGTK